MFLGEIIKVEEIQKKQREGEKLITKTLFCDAAKAANVYSSKSQKRVVMSEKIYFFGHIGFWNQLIDWKLFFFAEG